MKTPFFAACFLASSIASLPVSLAQNVIDLESKAILRFDGESEDELEFKASLIDGFTYRFDVDLQVSNDVELSDLYGKTICQCATLQFDRKNAQRDETVPGHVLMRPKSGDLMLILDGIGTRPGEIDPIRFGRIKLNCRVFAPFKLVPPSVEVENDRFPLEYIQLKLSKDIELVEATMSDSNSHIKAIFEPDEQQFRLETGDGPLPSTQGELTALCTFMYKERKGTFEARLPYAPRPSIRVIPSTVTFRADEDQISARLVVIGFSPSETVNPTFNVEQWLDGKWQRTDAECIIDSFSFGKAVTRIVFGDVPTESDNSSVRKMRLVDAETGVPIAEFGCVFR
jgi:hypothetical protein